MGGKREKRKERKRNCLKSKTCTEPYKPVNIVNLINREQEEFTDSDWYKVARIAIKLRKLQ